MAPKKRVSREDTQSLLPEGPTSSELDAKYAESNLCCCSRRNCVRLGIARFVEWSMFDAFILLVIIANCVMMAYSSPLVEVPSYFKKVEFIFNIIFLIEMFLKIVALGLSDYLKDSWNLLDVVVVSTAWAPYLFPKMGNYSAIRAIRVLRALRTVNRIPSLKKIIKTLASAIPEVRRTSARHRCRRHARARMRGRQRGQRRAQPTGARRRRGEKHAAARSAHP